ncbi:MAG: hypothetical protein DME20_09220 [Verrucomicrobia bacterium]|nr:MAG: hypothetical protein DME20_09220 [Verrucomicrobiota bacterium]
MNANPPTPEIVGPTAEVVALERSGNFIRAIDATCRAHSLPNLKIHELDLMTDDLPGADYDFAWCRWVISFVSDPALLIRKLARVMPKGSSTPNPQSEIRNFNRWHVFAY